MIARRSIKRIAMYLILVILVADLIYLYESAGQVKEGPILKFEPNLKEDNESLKERTGIQKPPERTPSTPGGAVHTQTRPKDPNIKVIPTITRKPAATIKQPASGSKIEDSSKNQRPTENTVLKSRVATEQTNTKSEPTNVATTKGNTKDNVAPRPNDAVHTAPRTANTAPVVSKLQANVAHGVENVKLKAGDQLSYLNKNAAIMTQNTTPKRPAADPVKEIGASAVTTVVTIDDHVARPFGNQMFSYATLLGIAQENGLEPIIPADLRILKIFKTKMKNSVDVHQKYAPFRFVPVPVEKCDDSDTKVSLPQSEKSVMLTGFWHSWHFFKNVEDQLREDFKFRDDIEQAADKILRSLIPRIFQNSNYVTVGIHVIQTDILFAPMSNTEYSVAPPSYFAKAIDYFRKKFKQVIFVVVSTDIKWCEEHIKAPELFYVKEHDPDINLAILSKCDHMIISVGSYGWWAAWLANGITVYYNEKTVTTGYAKETDCDYYHPPGWIPMH